MNDFPYLPPACKQGRCLRYRSRRCLSGECTHGSQNLLCAVNYPTTTENCEAG